MGRTELYGPKVRVTKTSPLEAEPALAIQGLHVLHMQGRGRSVAHWGKTVTCYFGAASTFCLMSGLEGETLDALISWHGGSNVLICRELKLDHSANT